MIFFCTFFPWTYFDSLQQSLIGQAKLQTQLSHPGEHLGRVNLPKLIFNKANRHCFSNISHDRAAHFNRLNCTKYPHTRNTRRRADLTLRTTRAQQLSDAVYLIQSGRVWRQNRRMNLILVHRSRQVLRIDICVRVCFDVTQKLGHSFVYDSKKVNLGKPMTVSPERREYFLVSHPKF